MKKIGCILVLILCVSCQDVERPKKPEHLISKGKMVQILTEAYTGNAARSINNKTIRDAGIQMDSIIYQKFGVDSLLFAQSNIYYASQLNDYIDIMTQVEKALVAKKVLIDTLVSQETKNQRDSLETHHEKALKQKDTTATQLVDPVQD